MPSIGDTVKVINQGDDPIPITWDSRTVTCSPGKDAFVSYEAACLYFGNPSAGDSIVSTRDHRGIVGFIPDRATEVRRLKMLYGDNQMADETFIGGGAPSVELYDVEGNRIYTVLDDPVGEKVLPIQVTQDSRTKDQERIARLEALVNRLMSEREGKDLDELQGDEDEDDGSDGTKVPAPVGSLPPDE